mmetsp:Transcript_34352/g.98753  ORF Transcript_34352/g.98753 Transcript_34352/m.98753 type:complete len:119 (+) Transcript_34352:84-440(+)
MLAATGPLRRVGAVLAPSCGGLAAARPLTRVSRSFCASEYVPPVVKYKKKKFCPHCSKRVEEGDIEDMRSACSRMWRKFMRLDDLHCPLFRYCTVREAAGHDEIPSLWEPMPRLKGRS